MQSMDLACTVCQTQYFPQKGDRVYDVSVKTGDSDAEESLVLVFSSEAAIKLLNNRHDMTVCRSFHALSVRYCSIEGPGAAVTLTLLTPSTNLLTLTFDSHTNRDEFISALRSTPGISLDPRGSNESYVTAVSSYPPDESANLSSRAAASPSPSQPLVQPGA